MYSRALLTTCSAVDRRRSGVVFATRPKHSSAASDVDCHIKQPRKTFHATIYLVFNAFAQFIFIGKVSKVFPRASRINKFHPGGIPAAPGSMAAIFPQHLSPFTRISRGIRGIPATRIPIQTSTLLRCLHISGNYVRLPVPSIDSSSGGMRVAAEVTAAARLASRVNFGPTVRRSNLPVLRVQYPSTQASETIKFNVLVYDFVNVDQFLYSFIEEQHL